MPRFEYKVVPAPRKGDRARGARTTEARFAQALMSVMNDLGRDGWEYLRSDTLPCEARSGLTGKSTVFQNMLVFRRTLDDVSDVQPSPAKQQTKFKRAPERTLSALVADAELPHALPETTTPDSDAAPPNGADRPGRSNRTPEAVGE
ncbi:MAG: DUF4177 domain-containing protein [Halocynthiibacter sp.]